jgi:hypothetical protein
MRSHRLEQTMELRGTGLWILLPPASESELPPETLCWPWLPKDLKRRMGTSRSLFRFSRGIAPLCRSELSWSLYDRENKSKSRKLYCMSCIIHEPQCTGIESIYIQLLFSPVVLKLHRYCTQARLGGKIPPDKPGCGVVPGRNVMCT